MNEDVTVVDNNIEIIVEDNIMGKVWRLIEKDSGSNVGSISTEIANNCILFNAEMNDGRKKNIVVEDCTSLNIENAINDLFQSLGLIYNG